MQLGQFFGKIFFFLRSLQLFNTDTRSHTDCSATVTPVLLYLLSELYKPFLALFGLQVLLIRQVEGLAHSEGDLSGLQEQDKGQLILLLLTYLGLCFEAATLVAVLCLPSHNVCKGFLSELLVLSTVGYSLQPVLTDMHLQQRQAVSIIALRRR